jgi:hypothetical protein
MYKAYTLEQTLWFFGSAFVIVLFAIVGDVLGMDYVWCGPLAVGIGLMVYYYKPSLPWAVFAICACLTCASLKPGVLLAIPVVCCYDPMRSCRHNKWLKYGFYAFYPVHLTILGLMLEFI